MTTVPLTGCMLEVFDGLMLGAGRLCRAGERPGAPTHYTVAHKIEWLPWLQQIRDEFRMAGIESQIARGKTWRLVTVESLALEEQLVRWYEPSSRRRIAWRKVPPSDIHLTPLALAYWYGDNGSRSQNGYSLHLGINRFKPAEVQFLCDRLRALYGWEARPCLHGIRIARSGDRLALKRMVARWIPACMIAKLNIRESKPCSEAEATRRRQPYILDPETARAIRQAATDTPTCTYARIGEQFGVSERLVGQVARSARWREVGDGVTPVRRRGPIIRLSEAQISDILARVQAGESLSAVGRAYGIAASRVIWLRRRHTL